MNTVARRLLIVCLTLAASAPGAQAGQEARQAGCGPQITTLENENKALQEQLNQLKKPGQPPGSGTHVPGETIDPGNIPEAAFWPPSRQTQEIAGAATVIIAGVLTWFLVVAPRRRRRPLVEATELLARHEPDDLRGAERLLVRALTAGLRPTDVADARFHLAYTRAALERYGEAEATLADLDQSGDLTQEAAYLQLWLFARQRKHQDVERMYERHAALLQDVLQAKRLFSITFLHLARKSLALRETAMALDYFDRVRSLRVLADQIPADLEDHHLAFGVGAAFEQKWDEARKHFEAAADTARVRADRANPPHAELALLICDWREDAKADVDTALTGLLPLIEARRTSAKAAKTETDDTALLISACRLWHLFTLLRAWSQRPPRQTLDDADRKELAARLAATKKAGSDLCEPWLIEGLIEYYFAGAAPAARARAVKSLEEAVKREMSVPEVLMLLELEVEQQRLMREGLPTYLKLMRSYLHNVEVSESVRRDVRAQLQRFERFAEIEDSEAEEAHPYSAPSIADLQTRVDITFRRISELVRTRLSADRDVATRDELDTLARQITESNAAVREQVTRLEETEGRLTVYAGELLLAEEPVVREEA